MTGNRVTIYRQVPGADIEPGWWAVVAPPWWDQGERARWCGPYDQKRKAEMEANQVLKGWPS